MHRKGLSIFNALIASAALAGLVLTPGYPVLGLAAAEDQSNAKYARLEAAVQQAVKRSKAAEEADALYALGKAHFDNHDIAGAEPIMRQALEKENLLQRPDMAISTREGLAGILVGEHKIAEATALYKEAIGLASKQEKNDRVAAISISLGILAITSNQLDEAERLFNQAHDLAVKNKIRSLEASSLLNLAEVSRAGGRSAQAITYLGQVIPILKELGDDQKLGGALTQLGRTQADLGKYDEAIASDKEAIAVFKDSLQDLEQAKTLLSLGQVYITREQPAEAMAALKEAAEILKQPDAECSPGEYIDVLTGLGAALAASSQIEPANQTLEEAMKLAKSTKDGARQRRILSESAYVLLLQGSPEKALDKYHAAYTMLQRDDPNNLRVRAVLLSDLAQCYRAVGQTDAAINAYQQSAANCEKLGDNAGKATALNGLSVAYFESGHRDLFEENYQKARDIYLSLKDKSGEGKLTYNYAQYQMVLGHYAEAIPLYEQARKIFEDMHDDKSLRQTLSGLALAYLASGKADKALELYQQALAMSEKSGSIEAKWDCELGLGKSYKALGQSDKAIEHLVAATDLVEKERRQLSRDSFKTFNMDLRQDCFIELVDSLAASGDAEKSLEVAERGRARAFLDLLEGRQSRRPNDVVSEPGSPLPGTPIAQQPLSVKSVGEAGSRGVQIVPRAAAVVEASTISPVNALPPDINEIKALVAKSGGTFVEYYLLPERIVTWVVHPDGKVEMPPPMVISRRQLTDKISEAVKSITVAPKGFAEVKLAAATREAKLKDLHKLLLQNVLPLLPKDCGVVTIVPHGPIFSVPFAALINPAGRYLVQDLTLSYVPAIGVLRATQRLANEAKDKQQNLLAFGNPITKAIAFLGTLPYSEKEVQHVAELFGADKSTVRIGEKASKPAFTQLAPSSSVIHLATHGLINEEHPMESALVLAPQGGDDGLLTVKDILKLPSLNAKLVVLSACQTAKGKITGDGVVGLSRAFVIAGTPAILVSQWNVDDLITEFQMVHFYRDYLKSNGNAKSLRDAQIKTITLLEKPPEGSPAGTTVPRANPKYWAAFELIGETR